jgi:hypothetical protein
MFILAAMLSCACTLPSLGVWKALIVNPRRLYLINSPHIALALNNHMLVLFALGFFISKQSQQHNEFLVLVQ